MRSASLKPLRGNSAESQKTITEMQQQSRLLFPQLLGPSGSKTTHFSPTDNGMEAYLCSLIHTDLSRSLPSLSYSLADFSLHQFNLKLHTNPTATFAEAGVSQSSLAKTQNSIIHCRVNSKKQLHIDIIVGNKL